MKIKEFIDRHERVKVIWEALQKNSDEQFRKRVLGTDCLNISVMENTNIDRKTGKSGILYQIEMGTWGDGFFAEYKKLLNYLYFADFFQWKPCVHFSNQFTYAEDHPINGTENPFEYFFEPIVKMDDANEYRYYVNSREVDWEFANRLKPVNGYDISEEYIQAMSEINQKYIKFNDITLRYLQSTDDLLGKNKVLGVHVRLTDFKQIFLGHPVCITAEEHLKYAVDAVKKYGFNKIFLATDDVSTVDLFRKEFGKNLLYYEDVTRSSGDVSVAFSDNVRENHHYKLALEVIRDMYTLSRCNGLIAGKSQVSICAIIENRRNSPYEFLKIVDKGNNIGNAKKYSDTDIVKG